MRREWDSLNAAWGWWWDKWPIAWGKEKITGAGFTYSGDGGKGLGGNFYESLSRFSSNSNGGTEIKRAKL